MITPNDNITDNTLNVIIFEGQNVIIFKCRGYYHFSGVNVIIFEGLDVIIFKCRGCYHFSWCQCYHFCGIIFRVLSFMLTSNDNRNITQFMFKGK